MQFNPTKIPNLTPLRGIAAIMVAVFHFDSVIANFVDAKHTMVINKCYLMVDLFFIMSGFIMFHVYGQKFSTAIKKSDFVSYIGARFARIYPLHLFTLLLSVAMFYGLHQPPSPINNPYAIPTHLLLLHSFGIHDVFTWNVPSWSISAEWAAYLLFPLFALFIVKFRHLGAFMLSIISLVCYFSIMYLLPRVNPFVPSLPVPHDLNVTYDYGYIRGIAGFIAGMVVYYVFQKPSNAKFFNNDWINLFAIFLVVWLFHFGANDFLIICSFILLVLAIASNQKRIHQLFQLKSLQYLGEISYSIYLTHGLSMFFVALPIVTSLGYVYKGPASLQIPFFTGVWICTVYLLSIVLISSITYYFIERPSRQWINKKFGNEQKAIEGALYDTSLSNHQIG